MLGVPDGLLGVAWPQMRRAHHQPASALAVLLLGGTCAFFATSSMSGLAAQRFRAQPLVTAAAVAAALGALAVGTSTDFRVAVVGVVLLGAGGGMIDPLLSSITSLDDNARLVGFMHGVFAIGAAGAPLLIAASASSSSWRVGYLAVAGAFGLLVVGWNAPKTRGALVSPPPPPRAASGPVARRGDVVVALAAFFAVSGLEIAAGAWSAVFLTDALGQTPSAASLGVLGYWAALSIARLSAGALSGGRPGSWIAAGCLAGLVGAVLFWLHPNAAVAVAGLALLGAGVGPLLPLLTVLTPRRVGQLAAANVIGWQLAAASLGAALVAGGIGLWVRADGVGAITPALALVALVTAGLVAMLERRTRAGLVRAR